MCRSECTAFSPSPWPSIPHLLHCLVNSSALMTHAPQPPLLFHPHTHHSIPLPHSQTIQFSSVTQSCLTLCNPMNRSTASLSITSSRSSLRLTSIESVMPSSHLISVVPFSSCPQSLPASESFPMSQLLHEVAKVLELQLYHHSLQRNPRANLLQNGLVGSP